MKKLFIFLTICIMMASGVFAAANYLTAERLPANNTYQTSRTIDFVFMTNISGDSTGSCIFVTNANSSNSLYPLTKTFSVTNNSFYYYTMRDVRDGSYVWNVTCANASNSSQNNVSGNYNIYIGAASNPGIVFNKPTTAVSNNANGNLTINVTAVSSFADKCVLYGNVNTTSNSTQSSYAALETQSYTSGSSIEFNETGKKRLLSNATYNFYVICNNSAGVSTTSSIVSFIVSRGFAQASNCLSPANNTLNSANVVFNWSAVSGSNFGYYNLSVNDSGTITNYLIYNNNTLSYSLNLTPDNTTYWSVVPYDKAGNANSTGNCTSALPFKITTAQVGNNLIVGWNVFAWNRATANLSVIGSLTGSSIVSTWNYSSNSFVSYIGTSTNSGVDVTRGMPVWVYASSASNLYLGWTTNTTPIKIEVSNASAVTNVPVGITNFSGYTLSDINSSNGLSCFNLTAITLVNQSNGRYVNYFCGFNESASVVAKANSVIWLSFNASGITRFNFTG